jgi:hypothetical protein
MQHRFTVFVDVDPALIEGNPADVLRDERKSNLEWLDYVKQCTVTPLTEPAHGATASGVSHRGRTTMTDEQQAAEPSAQAEAPAAKRIRLPRQGNVHATLTERHGSNGPFYTIEFDHGYFVSEELKFNKSFKATDMPDVMKQAAVAQEKIAELTQARGQAR